MKDKMSMIACFSALAVLCLASGEVIDSARAGLKLCYELILPSLLPFFMLSLYLGKSAFPASLGRLLSPLSRLLGYAPEAFTALPVGLLGGYPMGAAYLCALEEQGRLRPEEGEALLRFVNNSGPAFLVGSLGAGVFHSKTAGLLLWLCHALAAISCGLLFRKASLPAAAFQPAKPGLPASRAFIEAVREAVSAALNVCGFVVCFSVLTGLLDSGGWLDALISAISPVVDIPQQVLRAGLIGFFELGSGIGAMRGLPLTPENLALAAALVGWGGVSVHFQTLGLLADSKMNSAPHLTGRCLSAVLGAIYAYLAGSVLL